MAWIRSHKKSAGGGGSSEIDFQPLPFTGESHNAQWNRSGWSFNGNEMAVKTGGNYDCLGVVSIPVSNLNNGDYVLVKYQLTGVSSVSNDYFATVFFSDSRITSIDKIQSGYGYSKLEQQTLASGTDGGYFFSIIKCPGSDKFFNIQLGCSSFKSLKLFYGNPS